MHEIFSLDAAAKLVKAEPAIIRRAVANGLAVPLEEGEPFSFTEEEVRGWIDPSKRWELLGARMRRGPHGAFVGQFVEPGEYRQRNRYILPFTGCWLNIDGGNLQTADGRIRNTHYYCEPWFRWSSDFTVIAPDDYPKCRRGMTDQQIMSLRHRRGQNESAPDFERSESETYPFDSWGKTLNPQGIENQLGFLYEMDVIAPADGIFMTRQGATEDRQFNEYIASLAKNKQDDELGFLLDHGKGELSQIGHVLGRTLEVRPGQRVRQGQVICKAGGRTNGMPHLHWAVRDNWNDYLACTLPITIAECLVYAGETFETRRDVWLEKGMLVKNTV